MKKEIEQLFECIVDGRENNSSGFRRGSIFKFPRRRNRKNAISGSKKISFNLDKNGRYDVEAEPFGAGIAINYSIMVDDPNAIYNITIYSSEGGGGEYKKIKSKQKINGVLKTNKEHKTKIKINIQANKSDVVGHATIDYSI